jgi:DNA-binding NarL/FixJ family response regulator
VTIIESCGHESVHVGRRAVSKDFDLVILTNTCLTPPHIRRCVLRIKTRYPHARTLVLSGYSTKDFVADLREKGIDGFLTLPYEEESLLIEIAWLLSTPKVLT